MRIRDLQVRLLALGAILLIGTVPLAGGAAEPFEINAILPQTGPGAFLGKEESQSLSVIEETVNKTGGIQGRPIKFVIQDDQSSPQTAVQLMNNVVAKNPAVILGSSLAAICNAMAPLTKNGPVQYCFSPGIQPAPGGYVFSSSISTADLLVASAKFFAGRQWRKIAVITSNDATGQDAERAIDTAFSAAGSQAIVDREHFNTTDVSVTAQMAHIKASGAQAVIAWSSGTPVATILRGITDSGIELPIQTTSANGTYAQMRAYASFLPKQLYFSAPPALAPDQLPNGQVKHAIMAYLDAFKPTGVRPDVGQALAWDPAWLVIDAYKKLGLNATASQMRDYIAGLSGWAGINGRYDFHAIPQRGVGSSNVVVARWDATKDTWVALSKPGGDPLR